MTVQGPGISAEPPREVREGGAVEEAEEEVLEEEELVEEPQLRLEEEAEAEEEVVAAEPAASPEPARPGVYRLFGHELEEVAGGEVSVLRCVRCGAEAPLTEAAALRERPCNTNAPSGGFCRVCGKTGVQGYCDECAKSLEDYALVARPLVEYGRRAVKVLPPESPPADGWAWVGTHKTFFPYLMREGVRVWPCPACGREFPRMVDAIEHFGSAHPEKTGGFERGFISRTRGELWRTWQGYVCPGCGRLVPDQEKHRCGEEG